MGALRWFCRATMMPAPRRSPHSISHPGLRRVSRIKGRTHVSTRPRATPLLKISLAPQGASTHVAKFWRLPRVEPAGAICASEPEVAHDPERPCREAEAPVEGRFQGPPLRSDPDPAGGLVVPALSPELPRHRGAVPGARPGGRPLHPEPLGAGLRSPDRTPAAALPQTPLRVNPGRRDLHQDPWPVALPVPGHRQAWHARG